MSANTLGSLGLTTILAGFATGQIEVVKDIHPGTGSSHPRALSELDGTLYFLARPGGQNELWESDGTGAGTRRVRALPDGTFGPELVRVGDLLFFTHSYVGEQLWVSDGSALGTRPILLEGGSFSDFTPWGDQLVFVHKDSDNATRLMRSDGTVGGTGPMGWAPPVTFPKIAELITYGERLFFVSDLKVEDRVVRKIVTLHRDTGVFRPLAGGVEDPRPEHLNLVNDTLVFTAFDDAGRRELWYTFDATTILPFATFGAVAPGSRPREMTVVGNRLFGWADFQVTDEAGNVISGSTDLFVSDGTPWGTRRVTQGLEGAHSAANGTRVGDKYLFVMAGRDPGSGISLGAEPWVSDGTAAGTKLLRDIDPLGNSFPSNFLPVGSRQTFFAASTDLKGAELWVTRGDRESTDDVEDLYPGIASSMPEHLFQFRGRLYFSAKTQATGRELFRLDPGAISVGMGDGWSSDGGEGVGLFASDLVPDTTAVVQSGPLPQGAVAVLVLGFPATTPWPLAPGALTWIDAGRPARVVSVQTNRVQVEIPVLDSLPPIEAVFQAAVLEPSTLELLMLTNPVMVYTERY